MTRRRSRSRAEAVARAAAVPIRSSAVSRDRASSITTCAATFSRLSRNSDDGGTSRRSTRPSSTRTGSTRDAWAGLTLASRATVRRLELAHEYEIGAAASKGDRPRALRQRGQALKRLRRFSTTASGLAGDYAALASEELPKDQAGFHPCRRDWS